MLVAALICLVSIGIMAGIVAGGGNSQSDEERIREFLSARDSELIRMAIRWERGFPGGTHKIGRHGGYVYDITYVDVDDNTHFAECETSAAIGVVLQRDGARERATEVNSDDQR